MNTPPPHAPPDARSRAAVAAAAVAAVFCLTVCGLLVANYLTVPYAAPIDSPEMAALRSELAKDPTREELKARIRELDLALRQDFFRRRGFSETGAWLLLAGTVVALACLRLAAAGRPLLPRRPGAVADPDDPGMAARPARRAVTAAGLLLAGTALGFGLSSIRILPGADTPEAAAAPPPEPAPTPEDFLAAWPMFRGPGGLGRVPPAAAAVPASWNAVTGETILWKTEVPAAGKGSPVAWGDRVYLSGGDANRRTIAAFDAVSGALLWQAAVDPTPGRPAPPVKVQKDTGYAASTPATDGRRVYAIFANGDVGAVRIDGQPAWAKRLGPFENAYGHAASLAIAPGLLFVQIDQGEEEAHRSVLIAFDAATGRPAWQAKRPVGSGWCTPVLAALAARRQLLTSGNPWLIAYDPATGAELWRAKCQRGEVAPSPVADDRLVFAVNPNDSLTAVRPDGSGDVTKTHVAWKAEDGIPDICSPAADGERVYVLTTTGILTCYGAVDGKLRWEHDFETDCYASPTVVGERLLLITAGGVAIWVAASDTYRELGRSTLGEPVFASPAFLGGRIFIRGEKHLVCVGIR